MKLRLSSGLFGVIVKESIQMRRDPATIVMVLLIPLMQLILFGYAINNNPRNLPTAIVNDDHSIFSRRILAAMENSTYFKFIEPSSSEERAHELLKRGEVLFVINFAQDFSRDLVKGLRPVVLLEADATDPVATNQGLGLFKQLPNQVLNEELKGPLSNLKATPPAYEAQTHSLYNPLAITAYNIVPGLLGVVLTMTMVNVTSMMITREYERGTMENLLATPLTPSQVMFGKLVPYIILGYLQATIIIVMAKLLFHIPIQGNLLLLALIALPFIAANLVVGLTASTFATNQLQAANSAFLFFLPSIMLSGFMFPFYGMPDWAQWIGSALPLTHFLRIVRGILLKGNGFGDVWPELIPIIIFGVIMILIGFKRYRRTLD